MVSMIFDFSSESLLLLFYLIHTVITGAAASDDDDHQQRHSLLKFRGEGDGQSSMGSKNDGFESPSRDSECRSNSLATLYWLRS